MRAFRLSPLALVAALLLGAPASLRAAGSETAAPLATPPLPELQSVARRPRLGIGVSQAGATMFRQLDCGLFNGSTQADECDGFAGLGDPQALGFSTASVTIDLSSALVLEALVAFARRSDSLDYPSGGGQNPPTIHDVRAASGIALGANLRWALLATRDVRLLFGFGLGFAAAGADVTTDLSDNSRHTESSAGRRGIFVNLPLGFAYRLVSELWLSADLGLSVAFLGGSSKNVTTVAGTTTTVERDLPSGTSFGLAGPGTDTLGFLSLGARWHFDI